MNQVLLLAEASPKGDAMSLLFSFENNKRIADSDFIIQASQFFCVSSDYILGLTDNPLSVDDLLCMRRISLENLSDEDVSTVYSIVEELKNK